MMTYLASAWLFGWVIMCLVVMTSASRAGVLDFVGAAILATMLFVFWPMAAIAWFIEWLEEGSC